MKKNTSMIIAVIVILVIIVGGFAIFHKSPKKAATSTGSTTKSTTATVNNAVITTKTDASLGQYLATPSGMPLYTYNADTSGVSNCTGSCLTNWPAYKASSSSNLPTGLTTLTRTDNGQVQYAYNGKPLYTFVSDSVGHVTGNGVENFSIAVPAATSTAPTTTTPAPSSSSSSASGYNY